MTTVYDQQFPLPLLISKDEVDDAIRSHEDKVVVLRFGDVSDGSCTITDEIVCYYLSFVNHAHTSQLAKCQVPLAKMAAIYTVEAHRVPLYVKYFEITTLPSTVFFFNGHHMRLSYRYAVDSSFLLFTSFFFACVFNSGEDNTKFVGAFRNKQQLVDVVELVYRAALRGKPTVQLLLS